MTNDDGKSTDLFLSLTPERVLQAVEAGGMPCRPVCYPLNSFENRVYLIELEDGTGIVSKFYRPGRWTKEQILDEHRFLADLEGAEVPVCPTLPFPNGETLNLIDGMYYCLFRRHGGRSPDELSDAHAERLGMLVARMHNVGAETPSEHRIKLNADTYVWDNVAYLEANDVLPANVAKRYLDAAAFVADKASEYLRGVDVHRVHGDFHHGNMLLREGVFNILDFDDMVVGPAVQDLWLALPGRDQYARRQREVFLEGYERFRKFDRSTLRLIEPLRGLRMVHYATWLAKRWHDPIFPKTWPHFGTEEYWLGETADLEDLVQLLKQEAGEDLAAPEEPTLTNKDYFFDWED